MEQTDHVAGSDPEAESRIASQASPSCSNCIKVGRECLYIGPRLDEASQMRLAEIKEKQGTLERELERNVAKSTTAKNTAQQNILGDDDEESYLEVTPLAVSDVTYGDDVDEAGDMIDLGIKIGKMRITERIGGLSRPRISEEILAGISETQSSGSQQPQQETEVPGFENMPDFLKPGDEYMVPSSGFFFGQIGEPSSILDYLPRRPAADQLMERYFISVHPIAPCAHRPTLEATYATFWESINAGYEPRYSVQAIVFAAMFSGAVSMDETTGLTGFAGFGAFPGYSRADWVASLKISTENALCKANFLRTTKVETMQAFIMYMLPLCRAEVSRTHSVLVGAAVRMAECMGLHRDGEAFGLTPLETHVRRLIWHQLCFLDIRTCEAQGPKPAIRRDDYDTKLPLNCDDDDFTRAVTPPEPSASWTSNTLAIIRFEINEMMRTLWLDRRRVEMRKMTLPSVLIKIEGFRRYVLEKYGGLMDVTQPIQRYAKCVMDLLISRLPVMVLHAYHSKAAPHLPPELNQLLITSGITIVEIAIQLETNRSLRSWAWYLGAYFQYQIALLLASEVFSHPQSKEADRICSCLDYVFDVDPRLPPKAKTTQLLSEVQKKTALYMQMRKARGPTSLSRAVSSRIGQATNSSAAAQDPPQQQKAPLEMPQGVPKVDPGYEPPPMPAGPPMAQPQMVFAGISDGQALWSFPPNHASPESDSSSIEYGQRVHNAGQGGVGLPPQGNIMDNLNWDAFNSLFPSDVRNNEFSTQQGFHDPNFGVGNWGP
ncbi:hypothetical protein GGR52DRAFT_571143 [Hypoxylon sp. FL1284]|nr:hypothetical protein GGR52DRAFT_571143 [Hypoxylon sp. FL1284]